MIAEEAVANKTVRLLRDGWCVSDLMVLLGRSRAQVKKLFGYCVGFGLITEIELVSLVQENQRSGAVCA